MKKNICLVTYNLNVYGGAQRVCVNLANDFNQRGYKVKVISLELCKLPVYELQNNIMFASLIKDFRPRSILIPSIFYKLRKLYKDFSADIIMIIGSAATLGALPALLTKAKIIVSEHMAYKNRFEQNAKNIVNGYIGTIIADKIVTLTKDNMAECIKRYHLDKSKITYIYNYAPDIANTDGNFKYDENSKKIITVGRIEPVKGYDMLVEIAERILQRHPDWVWDIYGDIEDRSYFQDITKRIKDKKLTEKVRFCGHTNNLQNIFSQYAMYVMTSYHEGLPMVLLEAKAANLPLVSFDISTGPNEIIEDGVNGHLIPAYDIEKMVETVKELIENSEERKKLSGGIDVLKAKFSKEKIVDEWIDLIENI